MIESVILEKLELLFRETLDNSSIRLTEKTTANDIAEWDSVSHLILLHAIEQEFNLSFSLDEVMHFQNIGDITKSILAKL